MTRAAESLTNVVRHADASAVTVSLRRDNGRVRLTVADNGRGITEEEIDASESVGLLGMRERARALGGQIEFRGDGDGTRVAVTLPV